MHDKVWDEITYSFPNLNSAARGVTINRNIEKSYRKC